MPDPFVVGPAEPRDIPYLSTIQWAALLSNPLIQTLYPLGPTPALTAFTRDSYSKAMTYPSVRLIKATDIERGEIVAFAKWIVYPEEGEKDEDEEGLNEKEDTHSMNEKSNAPRSNSWVNVEGEKSSKPDGVNERALRAWNEVMNRTRRGIMGNRRHHCHSKTEEHGLECYFACFAPRLWGEPCPSLPLFFSPLSLLPRTPIDGQHSPRHPPHAPFPPRPWRRRPVSKMGNFPSRQAASAMLPRSLTLRLSLIPEIRFSRRDGDGDRLDEIQSWVWEL